MSPAIETRNRVRRVLDRDAESPFLPLGELVRLGLLFFLFAYRIVFPLMAALMSPGSKDLLALRFIAEFYYTCLLAYPFIFYRREYGWLHPLVLPTVYFLGKTIAKDPFRLLLPLYSPLVDFTVETNSAAAVLSMSNIDLAWARLELSLIYCFAQSVYLLAFLFGPTFTIPTIEFRRPRNIRLVSLIFLGLLGAIASVFIVAQGGVQALLVAMRGGRMAIFSGEGQFLFAGVAGTTILMVWFLYERRPWTSPIFLAGLVGALLLAIITTGSRSSVVIPTIGLLLLWWKRRGRVLVLPTVMVAVFGLLVIGVFGSIRQDFRSTHIDYSVLDPSTYGTSIVRALEDIKERSEEEAGLAVVAGAHQKGLLWGKTYAYAATFWLPRSVWPGKPRSADSYNMFHNFKGAPLNMPMPSYGVWGVPVTAELEAYWNLWYPGVAVVFALIGMFHATLAKAAYRYRNVPFFWGVYLLILTQFTGTSKEMVDLMRNSVLLLCYAYAAGILSFSSFGQSARRVFPEALSRG